MLEQLNAFNEAFPWLTASFAFIFGACWGSFFNVVIYRVPRGMSIIRPPSHCFACGAPIRWYDNLPVISWLILRGRARCCGAPFSPRYPIVELITGLLFLAAWLQLTPPVAAAAFIFIALMVIGSFIDFDTQELPDFVTVGGASAGLLFSMIVPELHERTALSPYEPWMFPAMRAALDALIGATVGSGVILWLAMFGEKLFRKEAMGFGDVLLMGCIGAFCGWQGAIFAIFGGALIGAVATALLMLVSKITGKTLTPGKTVRAEAVTEQKPATPEDTPDPSPEEDGPVGLGMTIPFGPWLAAGALVYLLFMSESADFHFARALNLIYNAP